MIYVNYQYEWESRANMALTGLDIFKKLPKTNCKDCGQSTCLAFAMAMAGGKAGIDQCPHVSASARVELDAASAPPMALIKIGTGDNAIEIGNETVLFRHDKRFEHECAIAVSVCDNMTDTDIIARVKKINSLVFDRIGQLHSVNMVAVCGCSGSAGRFAEAVKITADNTDYPLILKSGNPLFIAKALEIIADKKPLVYCADAANYKEMTELAKTHDLPLAVKGSDLNDLAEVVEKITALGWKKIILDSGARNIFEVLDDQTQIRRQALKKYRPLGYPTITFAGSSDPYQAALEAGVYITKYAGIVVLDSVDPADILPLITLRLNIFTDPQKPIAVESKIYEVLTPGPGSPVFVTTNFSLTYYCVAGDIEASRTPAYILPVDTDGVSVLTGWAAGKFTSEKIYEMIKSCGIEDRVSHRSVIIPGGVAVLKDKLQELSGWEVLVGPNESSGITKYLKNHDLFSGR
jgi:acetyl-CoA decarbonylase/synthase complex subunit gamma